MTPQQKEERIMKWTLTVRGWDREWRQIFTADASNREDFLRQVRQHQTAVHSLAFSSADVQIRADDVANRRPE